MKDEIIKKDNSKIFRTYTKNQNKTIAGAELKIEDWRPRNNSVVLRGERIKKASGLILPDHIDNPGDSYAFFVFKVGLVEDLKEAIGKAVILRDYSEIALNPIKAENDRDIIYCLTFEHNIVLIEE